MKYLKLILGIAFAAATVAATIGCKSGGHESMNHGMSMDNVRSYPLDRCVVSGDAFDHDQPLVFAYQGQEIKLCCKDCRKDFDKDPAKYLGKLAAVK